MTHSVEASGYGFPSGHAFGAAAVYLALAVGLACRWPRWRLPLLAVAWVIVVGVGVSRVYLGVHYLTDVVAGWLLGAATVTLLKRCLVKRGEAFVQRVAGAGENGTAVRR
ncbi:phosphatase PAP2 family protein [Myxococcota bacterium]